MSRCCSCHASTMEIDLCPYLENIVVNCYSHLASLQESFHLMIHQNFEKVDWLKEQLADPDLMKKVNKQCLLDTPRTVRVSEKT